MCSVAYMNGTQGDNEQIMSILYTPLWGHTFGLSLIGPYLITMGALKFEIQGLLLDL